MTVALIARRTQTFLGLAADTKPTGVPVGSEFYETDSGVTSIYSGSAWTAKADGGTFAARKSITFTGAAGLGAVGNVPLFTVTGEVEVIRLVPYTVQTLTEALATATLALTVTNSPALFIAATPVLSLVTGEFWTEATGGGTANAGVLIPAALKDIAITSNIVGTVAAQAVNGGTLRFDCIWRPLSADGLVVPV